MKFFLIGLICVFGLMSFIPKGNSSTTFIGNAGDGFLIGDAVYLSDLVLAGKDVYEYPWFGQQISPPLRAGFNGRNLRALEISTDLLLQKLTDLNDIEPGLGWFVAEAIGSHHWLFLDDNARLGPTCDRTVTEQNIPGSRQVQIANRYQDEIRIQKSLWLRMNEKHRVALVLHEGLYSLFLKKAWDGCLFGGANSARRIVAEVFTDPDQRQGAFPSTLLEQLDITYSVRRCQTFFSHHIGTYSLLLRRQNHGYNFGLSKEPTEESSEFQGLNYQSGTDTTHSTIHELCSSVRKIGWDTKSELIIRAIRKPYTTTFSNGKMMWTERSGRKSWTRSWNPDRCEKDLQETLDRWHNEIPVRNPHIPSDEKCDSPWELKSEFWNWDKWNDPLQKPNGF